MIFLGGLVHLAVVSAPLYAFGVLEGWRDPATLTFFLGVSALYAGDAFTMRWTRPVSSSPLDTTAKRWASATGVILLVLFWTCLIERSIRVPGSSWFQAPATLLLWSGVALRAAAVRTLGKHFCTEIDRVDGALVRSGIYRVVRHPSETGLLAAALGAALLLQSALGIVVWAGALLPVTLARLSLEERALERRFGLAYARYREQVGGLLPFSARTRTEAWRGIVSR